MSADLQNSHVSNVLVADTGAPQFAHVRWTRRAIVVDGNDTRGYVLFAEADRLAGRFLGRGGALRGGGSLATAVGGGAGRAVELASAGGGSSAAMALWWGAASAT